MNIYNETEVLMLFRRGSGKKSGLYLDSKNKLHPHNVTNGGRQQHLYILDTEIKPQIGDWCVEKTDNGISVNIFQLFEINNKTGICRDKEGFPFIYDACKKVMATTDKNLIIEDGEDVIASASGFQLTYPMYAALPSIPNAWVINFINQYNIGNKITKVFVQYVSKCSVFSCDKMVLNGVNSICCGDKSNKVMVNSENEIIIK